MTFQRQHKEYVTTDEDFSATKLIREKNLARAKYAKEDRDNEADPKLLKKANQIVTRPITRLYKPGRPRKFTPTKLRNRINDYFCDCEKRDKVPNLKGMMLYLKLNPQSAYSYAKYTEFEDIFQQARLVISEWLESDIYTTKGQGAATGKIAYMQNLQGWSNKTEVETSQREMTVEEARAKIEAAAPAILEMLKNNPELLAALLPKQLSSDNNQLDVVVTESEEVNE
jgi:hypothetical protein